jgi:flagellar biogenesis protein FliO
MTNLLGTLILLLAYFAVLRWVLPRLGVPT